MSKLIGFVFTALLWVMMVSADPQPTQEELYSALAVSPIVAGLITWLATGVYRRLAQVCREASSGGLRQRLGHSPALEPLIIRLGPGADCQDTLGLLDDSRDWIILPALRRRPGRRQLRPWDSQPEDQGRRPQSHQPSEGHSDGQPSLSWEDWLKHCERLEQAGQARLDREHAARQRSAARQRQRSNSA